MSYAVDLTRIAPPQIVEPLDYEAILTRMKAELTQRMPSLAPVLALESEPLTKLLEVAAWREMELRARVNAVARSIMLPWAIGTDLDNIAARYGVTRMAGENDDRLRQRVMLAYHRLSGAGSPATWSYHALSAHPDVVAADVWSPAPGVVYVAALARVEALASEVDDTARAIGRALFGPHPASTKVWVHATNTTTDPLLAVKRHLMADDVLPLTVDCHVVPATIVPYRVAATVVTPIGLDALAEAQDATARVQADAKARSAFRVDVHRSAIIGALMSARVRNVILSEPAADVSIGPGQIAVMTDVAVTGMAAHD